MKKYLQALYQSFGDPALYTRVIHHWTGGGSLYLLVIATLFSLLLAGQFSYAASRYYRDELPHLLEQLPGMTITDGVVTVTSPQPHFIRNRDNAVLASIDTTRDESELKKLEGALLVGKDFILMRQPDNDWRKVTLKDLGKGTLPVTKAMVEKAVANMRFLIFLFVPLLALAQWLMLIAMTVLAACMSYFVTAYMREEFNFETRMRMGAIALTPPLLVNALLKTFSLYYLGFWIILSVCVLHLYIMIVATRHYLRRTTPDAG